MKYRRLSLLRYEKKMISKNKNYLKNQIQENERLKN